LFHIGPLYYHNPTKNPKQLKTTFVGVVLLSARKTTTTPQCHYNLSDFKAAQKADFCLTQLEEIWKTTSTVS
jgi:hypothetical protein